MSIRKIAMACLAIGLAGCARAPSRLGLNAMNEGDCAGAIAIMRSAVQSGDAYSINNWGAIQEKGCPEADIPQDYNAAFESYAAAARKQVPIVCERWGAPRAWLGGRPARYSGSNQSV